MKIFDVKITSSLKVNQTSHRGAWRGTVGAAFEAISSQEGLVGCSSLYLFLICRRLVVPSLEDWVHVLQSRIVADAVEPTRQHKDDAIGYNHRVHFSVA